MYVYCVCCHQPESDDTQYMFKKRHQGNEKGDFLKRNQCSEYTSGQSGAGTLHLLRLSGPCESAGTKRSLVATVSLLNGREPPLPICRSALFYDRRLGRSTFICLQKNNLLIATCEAREKGVRCEIYACYQALSESSDSPFTTSATPQVGSMLPMCLGWAGLVSLPNRRAAQ